MRKSRILSLALACGCFCAVLFAEEKTADIIEPGTPAAASEADQPAPDKQRASPQTDSDAQNVARLPVVVDEPGFKATAVFPQQPVPKFDQNTRPDHMPKGDKKHWAVPAEEESGARPSPPTPQGERQAEAAQEELDPALAKVVAKERSGAKLSSLVPLYQEVARAEPENAAAHYYLGLALVHSGELLKALAELERAAVQSPETPRYQCDFGLAALQAGWLEKALVACEKAALAAPANARYQSAVGDVLLAAGQIVPACEAYTRAVNLDPNNGNYIFNLGVAHVQARAFTQAIEIFDEAIRLKPESSQFHCNRGLAYEMLKNIKKAIEDYAVAVKLDKDNAYAHYLLAGVYSDPDDPTYTNRFEAVDHAEKAVKLTKYKNAKYLMGLARALRVARNYDQAVEAARKAVELDARDDYKKELGQFESLKQQGFAP